MNTAIESERERVISQVLRADTRFEIEAAWRRLSEWMKTHPEDQAMRDGFEQMSLILDAIEEEEAGRARAASEHAAAGEAA